MTSLRIGFASVYAWRPHVEQMMFLARLVEQAGHVASFLACDADLPTCYTREIRDVRPDWMECLFCRVGGVRSYAPGRDVASLGRMLPTALPPLPQAAEWAQSSASTLGRFESAQDYASETFVRLRDKLVPTVSSAFAAASEWIRRERLDAVCVFNGRIDATRAIFEAARAAGIRTIVYERSWFGDGIQLWPEENCLGLRSVDAMVGEWSGVPLTLAQARVAAQFVAARITGTNVTEWRSYNRGAEATAWPVPSARRRILLLPGSLNEFWGEPQWQSEWPEPTAAYDALMDHLGLAPADLVLRCHPNWAERIGRSDGSKAEAYYSAWARARGVHLVGSAQRTSTMSLLAEADAVVIASGSSGLEASGLGTQVISTAPSVYQAAGFRSDATGPEALSQVRLDVDLDAAARSAAQDRLRRGSLRFAYAMTHRLPQFVQHVRAVSSAGFRYVPGADPERFLDVVRTGRLTADDPVAASSPEGEDEVIAAMREGRWTELRHADTAAPQATERVRRRWFLRPIDAVREKMPVGDR